MNCKANAKINLSLAVTGVREDGYHLLEMVNLPLELHDVVEVIPMPKGYTTHVICDDMRLMGLRSNLCYNAVQLMREKYHFDKEFMIRIHKNIPFAAGLGGGSSDGAVVIKAINSLLKLGASEEELLEIALKLGSDLPFFFLNKPAKVTGIGETVEPIKVKTAYHCLLIKPDEGLSTKDVYAKVVVGKDRKIETDRVVEGLKENDELKIAAARGHDLFRPACELLPVVGEIVAALRQDGFLLSGMSGSGSCCYALSLDPHKLKAEGKKFEKKGYQVILTKTIA